MLPPANADLVRRDSQLPGLATLLDVEEFLTALNASAPATELRSAHLRYLRYKPGQNCLAAYTLDVNGEGTECYAKAYRVLDTVKLDKASLRRNGAGPLRRGRFVWRSPSIEVCVFPNDNKVRSLALIADVARREDCLQRHLPDHPTLWRSSIRTLAYKPERRWVGALEVDGKPQAVCKLYGSMIDTLRSKSGAVSPGDVLRVAPLLGHFKRRALFLAWQDGRLLSEALLERDFNPANLARVGLALAELHRQDLAALPLVLRQTETASLLALGNLLAFLLPEIAPRIARAAHALARSVGDLPQREAVIHGDFHAGQVLVNGAAVTLLDLDEAGRGDAFADLGSFLAHIECDVICGRCTAARRDEILAALLEGYCAVNGETGMQHLDLHVAARLFARLPHFFRTCSPDWPVLTAAGLVRVESLLDGRSTSRSVVAANLSDRSLADENLPALSRALDAVEVRPLLESALRERDPDIALVRVRNVQLRRHKPGRRALIEYELESFGSGGFRERFVALGKMRARGVDEQNLEKLEALSHAGFSPASPDGISIPEQVGVVRELGLWLQRKVEGQPAAELLSSPKGVAVARRAAEAAHKLHCSRLSLERTHTPADEIALLRPRLAAAAELRPAWRERIVGVADACARLAGELPMILPRAIHRDFYHDQMLVAGDRVWLVDLDLLCSGDPALDAGNFIGHMIEWSLRSPGDHPALEAAAESFADRFLELTGADAQERVAIWTTLALARHVFISTQFPDRAPFTETILQRCEKHCDLARTASRVAAFSTAPI